MRVVTSQELVDIISKDDVARLSALPKEDLLALAADERMFNVGELS